MLKKRKYVYKSKAKVSAHGQRGQRSMMDDDGEVKIVSLHKMEEIETHKFPCRGISGTENTGHSMYDWRHCICDCSTAKGTVGSSYENT